MLVFFQASMLFFKAAMVGNCSNCVFLRMLLRYRLIGILLSPAEVVLVPHESTTLLSTDCCLPRQ